MLWLVGADPTPGSFWPPRYCVIWRTLPFIHRSPGLRLQCQGHWPGLGKSRQLLSTIPAILGNPEAGSGKQRRDRGVKRLPPLRCPTEPGSFSQWCREEQGEEFMYGGVGVQVS